MPNISIVYDCKVSKEHQQRVDMVKVKECIDMNPEIPLRIGLFMDRIAADLLEHPADALQAISLAEPFHNLKPTAVFVMPSRALVAYTDPDRISNCIWTINAVWDKELGRLVIKQYEDHPASMKYGKMICPIASPFSAACMDAKRTESAIKSYIRAYNKTVINSRMVMGFLRIPREL